MNNVERVLQAAVADAAAVEKHLVNQSEQEIDGLLQLLPQYQHEEGAIALVRLILGCPVDEKGLTPQVFQCVAWRRRQALDAIMLFVLNKKLHHKWVNEICMAYMIFADELRKSAMEIVESEIYDVIQSILGMIKCALGMPLTDATNFQSILDSVPYLITLVQSSTDVSKLVDELLELPWSTSTLHLVLNFAKECSLFNQSHHATLQKLVTASIPELSSQLSFGFWNDCIQGCFELSEKFKDIQWIQLCRLMLNHVPLLLERDLDYLFQTIFQHSPEYVQRFHSSLCESGPTEKDTSLLLHTIHASQPLFKLSIEHNDTIHAQLKDMLLKYFSSKGSISINPLLHKAAHWKAFLLLDLATNWLPKSLQVSEQIFLAVFDEVPELRLDVTNMLLNAVDHENSLKVIRVLVEDRAEYFSRFTPQFQDRISHLFPISVPKSTALIESLLPFVSLSPFYSFLMMFLRKHIVTPTEAHQKACISIWCTVLTKVTLSTRQQEDIFSCFHDIMKMPNLMLQQHLLRLLPSVLRNIPILNATLLPLQTAVKDRLDTFVSITSDTLQLSKRITEEDYAEVFSLCCNVLKEFGGTSAEHVSQVQAYLASNISKEHCIAYLQEGNPTSVVARVAMYAGFCDVAASEQALLLCCTLNRIQGHLQNEMLLCALAQNCCCLQRTFLSLNDLEKKAGSLSASEVEQVLVATASLYPELVQGVHKIPLHHEDFGLPMACNLKPLKCYKTSDIMTAMVRLWVSLAKSSQHFSWDAFLASWNIGEWDPLLAAFNQQLEQLVDSTSQINLAMIIAEMLRLVQQQLSKSSQNEFSEAIYLMLCHNAVGSPSLLRVLLALTLTEPTMERLAAVLSESQGLAHARTEHKYKRLRPAVTHPLLVSEATKSAAYTAAMKQLDIELQRWYQELSTSCATNTPWAILSALLHEAFEEPELSWKAVSGVIDSMLRIGKCVLPAIYGDEHILSIIQDIVYLNLRLLKAWQHGTSITVDLTTKMDIFLLEVTSTLTSVLKKKHGLGTKEREAVQEMTRCIMEHMETMTDITKKQTKKLHDQAQELRVATKKRRNNRLRSRHEYIDECLREEGGNDAFADLEDFIA